MQDIIAGFDLVSNLLSESDKAFIEYNLFRSTVITIRKNDVSLSNWQACHNTAIGAIGFCFNDSSYIDFAIHAPDTGTFKFDEIKN